MGAAPSGMPGMAGVGLLHGVDGERADGGDRQVVEVPLLGDVRRERISHFGHLLGRASELRSDRPALPLRLRAQTGTRVDGHRMADGAEQREIGVVIGVRPAIGGIGAHCSAMNRAATRAFSSA